MTTPCPTCKAPARTDQRWHPFCSERCKLLDLAAWFGERYTIAGERGEPELPPDQGSGRADKDGPA